MYLCSCLFLARSSSIAIRALALLGTGFPVLWLFARGFVQTGDLSLASQILYSFLPAALIPYTIGTIMWYKREQIKGIGRAWIAVGVVGGVVCTIFVYPHSVTLAYVLLLPCLAAILGPLIHWTASERVKKWDAFAGLMSYPLYLMHWSCAYVVVLALPTEWGWTYLENGYYNYSLPAFLCVTALVLLFSLILALLVEGPLDRRRHIWLKKHTSYNAR